MTVAHLAPHVAVCALLAVATTLLLREGHRGRARPGHGRRRPHSQHVVTDQQDRDAIKEHDMRDTETDTATYYERLDISEALESAGWIADDDYPLDILRKNGATFAIGNECGDSGVSKDGWTIEFPSDVPAVVVIAACLAAAGESFIPLATITKLHATEEPTR